MSRGTVDFTKRFCFVVFRSIRARPPSYFRMSPDGTWVTGPRPRRALDAVACVEMSGCPTPMLQRELEVGVADVSASDRN